MVSESSHHYEFSNISHKNQSQRIREISERKEVSYLDDSNFPESIQVFNNRIDCSRESDLKWNVKSNSLISSSQKNRQEANFDSLCKLYLQNLM